ncbi:hypothetical protein CVU37_12165 [candidate division BRC1 bacterium HGW-BRC1-1]|nr:MAG: hypothetical protein CVU37_12165 [candidate division BRC1 bacterium HGW-BRC1-1]
MVDVAILVVGAFVIAYVINILGLLIVERRYELHFPIRIWLRQFITSKPYTASLAWSWIDFSPFPSFPLLLAWIAMLCIRGRRGKAAAMGGPALWAGVVLGALGVALWFYLWFGRGVLFGGAASQILGHFNALMGLASRLYRRWYNESFGFWTSLLACSATCGFWVMLWGTEAWIAYRGVVAMLGAPGSRAAGLAAVLASVLVVPFSAALMVNGLLANSFGTAALSTAGGLIVAACIWFAIHLKYRAPKRFFPCQYWKVLLSGTVLLVGLFCLAVWDSATRAYLVSWPVSNVAFTTDGKNLAMGVTGDSKIGRPAQVVFASWPEGRLGEPAWVRSKYPILVPATTSTEVFSTGHHPVFTDLVDDTGASSRYGTYDGANLAECCGALASSGATADLCDAGESVTLTIRTPVESGSAEVSAGRQLSLGIGLASAVDLSRDEKKVLCAVLRKQPQAPDEKRSSSTLELILVDADSLGIITRRTMDEKIDGALFTPDGTGVVVFATPLFEKGSVKMLEADTLIERWHFEPSEGRVYPHFAPDGKVMAVRGIQTIWILSTSDGAVKGQLDGHINMRGGVNSLTFTPDSRSVLFGDYGWVSRWDWAEDREPEIWIDLGGTLSPSYWEYWKKRLGFVSGGN